MNCIVHWSVDRCMHASLMHSEQRHTFDAGSRLFESQGLRLRTPSSRFRKSKAHTLILVAEPLVIRLPSCALFELRLARAGGRAGRGCSEHLPTLLLGYSLIYYIH